MIDATQRTERVRRLLRSSRVIASVKDDAGLARMLDSRCRVGIILYGSILTLPEQLRRMQARDKMALVDIDLIDGLSADAAGVEFLAKRIGAQGLLSNKAPVVKLGVQAGLLSVHRHFMTDSMAFHNLERQVKQASPDAVELLPGCIPKVIGWLTETIHVPIIAGGLIHDIDDVDTALRAGATAVATSNAELWNHLPD